MVEVAMTTYIMGLVFWGGLFGFAVKRFGGFQGYADWSNAFMERAGSKQRLTSNQLQWRVVLYTIFWPFVVPLVAFIFWVANKEK
jgi:hypothetical protein